MTTPRDLLCRFHIIIVHSIYHIASSNERHARGNLITKKKAKQSKAKERTRKRASERERERTFFLRSFRSPLHQMKLSNCNQSWSSSSSCFCLHRQKE